MERSINRSAITFFRFLVVGGFATFAYLILVFAFAHLWPDTRAGMISLLAYGLAAAFSYFGHKIFTFSSSRAHRIEGPRFAITTALGFLISLALPILIHDWAGYRFEFAALSVAVVVPLTNFILLNHFVFRERELV